MTSPEVFRLGENKMRRQHFMILLQCKGHKAETKCISVNRHNNRPFFLSILTLQNKKYIIIAVMLSSSNTERKGDLQQIAYLCIELLL